MKNTKQQTETAMLVAIVVVLTILCTFIRFGPFSITLALAPIVVGASIYGPLTGALLGAVFGAVVIITGLFGWDGGTVMFLLSINLWAIPICLLKGAAAGYGSGLIFQALEKTNMKLGTIFAGIAAPVINTGLFVLGMMLCYMPTLQNWAGGQNLVSYVIFGLTGVNFLIEVLVNVVLSGAITGIVQYRKKQDRYKQEKKSAAEKKAAEGLLQETKTAAERKTDGAYPETNTIADKGPGKEEK